MGSHTRPSQLLLLSSLLVLSLHAASAQYCVPEDECWPSFRRESEWIASMSTGSVITRGTRPGYLFQNAASPTPDENLLKTAWPGPGYIVTPASEDDMVKAVKFAYRYKIRIVAKCSGHHSNGRSTGNGVMLIKTELLKNMTYNATDNTVTFEAGCNHGDVYGFANGFNRTAVGGKYKTVCPAGCLTGGCHGPLTREYGLGADNVVSLRIVLPSGRVTVASRTQNSDLFNAMLGGGQSSFGVISRMTVRTYPSAPVIRIYARFRRPQSAEETPNVLTDYFFNATWIESLPTGVGMYLESVGLAAGSDTFAMDVTYVGDNAVGLAEWFGPVLGSPYLIADSYSVGAYANFYNFAMEAFGTGSSSYVRTYATNVLLPPDQDQLNLAAALLASAPQPTAYIWYTYGGRVREGTVGSFSAGMRSAMLQVNIGALWSRPNEDEAVLTEQIAPVVAGSFTLSNSSYINEYVAHELAPVPDWKTRFYADYPALLRVKAKYDPCNMFTVEHGVASDLPAATCRRN